LHSYQATERADRWCCLRLEKLRKYRLEKERGN
jgi:hypothetical protein